MTTLCQLARDWNGIVPEGERLKSESGMACTASTFAGSTANNAAGHATALDMKPRTSACTTSCS
ncbi:hypothetical protein HNO88_004108 [Novosphingobium chloroacetimidivorans]|uniref:Uncharacterized protein n=1 Tax=Novosphingobium chloroacetimidivorans TaxID=1428314 RepID=A0A7W7KEU8_9SPHN|nr:hypothetical protein [Novosphingobium chloroacetimidivorans]